MNSAFTHHPPLQQSINNNAVPQQHDQLSPEQIVSYVEGVIEQCLNNSLWFRVQCVNCDEAGVLLSVDTDTVRQWIKAGKLSASKVGREWSIRLVDIDKMLSQNATVIRMNDKRFKANRKKAS